jgi:AcrR family transcriptional regulator
VVGQANSGSTGAAGTSAVVEGVPEVPEGERPMRADARRNYERLVAAAKEEFAENGVGASMEAIARRAGVGVGTLYRHFPKRIDVVEAVYRTDVDELVLVAEKSLAEPDAWEGLVSWLHAFLGYAQTKRTLLSELRQSFESNPGLKCATRDRIDAAVESVFGRAQRAGVVRSDVDGSEVMQLISPLCTTSALSAEQAERLLAMILDGLRRPVA